MDQKVLEAQQWVNATYGSLSGYVACPEDGNTGWTTMYSLTMGLQHELGITTLSANFGPTTLADLALHGDIGTSETNKNLVNIVQYGLFCKGYWGGDGDGVYGTLTSESVQDLKSDAGLDGDGSVQPKVFKALLTMDAYVLLSGGSNTVRSIQQWLNGRYFANRDNFYLIPCDGHFSRGVQTALMQAIQYELGVPTDSATGNFGPSTQAGLAATPLSDGSTGVFVQLFSAAVVCNGATSEFTSSFDSNLAKDVRAFQQFSGLDQSGGADYETWCQLLVSMGDADRPGTACDCITTITDDRATALKAAGYTIVGRYLDERPSDHYLNKRIQPGELDTIFRNGMRVFPISQYNGGSAGYFTYPQGYTDALGAHTAAVGYGFDPGTVIYFSVDFDATDDDISNHVIDYFLGVSSGLASQGKRYIYGVYGSRNVCSRVTDEAYAAHSFVSGMSWGYSGNLGYPLPANWAFNQIQTLSTGSGTGAISIDKDVHRTNADSGVNKVNSPDSPLDSYLQYLSDLYQTAVAWGQGDPNIRVLEYLRYPNYTGVFSGWTQILSDPDDAWIAYADANGPARVTSYTDPVAGISIKVPHFGATANGVAVRGQGSGSSTNLGDFAGWGGDLSTFYGEWRKNSDTTASGYTYCMDNLAKINASSTFMMDDLIEDADGYLIGMQLSDGSGTTVVDAVTNMLRGGGALSRFRRFFDARYGGNGSTVYDTAMDMLTNPGVVADLRIAAVIKLGGALTLQPAMLPDDLLDPFVQGYVDTLVAIVGQEND